MCVYIKMKRKVNELSNNNNNNNNILRECG